MKKTLLVTMIISAAFAANAQWCGTVAANCTAGPNTQLGFQNSDSIPCIIQGQAYNYTSPFKMYSMFTAFGNTVTLDSIMIDTIYNLPCGVCWSLSKASRTYAAGETGCFNFTGTSWDAVGQYNMRLSITAYIHNAQSQQIPPNLVDGAGIKIWLRVAASEGSCLATDTASGAADQTTNSPCAVGINEVAANVASLNIIPNPVNSNATISFTAERNAAYTIKITDITGQVVSVKLMDAAAGVNTTNIERGKLSAGIYLLSLTDGVSSVTRKFIVAD